MAGFLWRTSLPAPWNSQQFRFTLGEAAGRHRGRDSGRLSATASRCERRRSVRISAAAPTAPAAARCTLASTSAGSSPSISISAIALPPGASRPTWKVAMLMPASPSVDGERADEARLVEIGDVDHRRAELRVHADALDVDDARAAVGEHRAGHPARLPLGLDRHGDQALVVAVRLRASSPRPRCRAPWRPSAPTPR